MKMQYVQEDVTRIKVMCDVIISVLKRKDAETALQHSDERYRGLVNTMQDIVHSVSAEGKIIFIGPQVERYGYKPKELISKSFIDFIYPEDREMVLKDFQQTISTSEGLSGLRKWAGLFKTVTETS